MEFMDGTLNFASFSEWEKLYVIASVTPGPAANFWQIKWIAWIHSVKIARVLFQNMLVSFLVDQQATFHSVSQQCLLCTAVSTSNSGKHSYIFMGLLAYHQWKTFRGNGVAWRLRCEAPTFDAQRLGRTDGRRRIAPGKHPLRLP